MATSEEKEELRLYVKSLLKVLVGDVGYEATMQYQMAKEEWRSLLKELLVDLVSTL